MTREELNKIVYVQQLEQLRLHDVAQHVHIITGASGKCMCRHYSGRVITCQEILAKRSEQLSAALAKEGVVFVL